MDYIENLCKIYSNNKVYCLASQSRPLPSLFKHTANIIYSKCSTKKLFNQVARVYL